MEEKNRSGVVPENYTGKIIDIEERAVFNSEDEARSFFTLAKDRLLTVNEWEKLAGTASATFQLVDSEGNDVYRRVQKDDYFKIDIPGPGPIAGDGYDWVKVEEVKEVQESHCDSVGIRVRPTQSPLNKSTNIAHFYSPESTSSFTVTREGSTVIVGIYDRNTKPNDSVDTLVDKVRDLAVGSGAVTAFSRIQWESLAKGILHKGE